MTAFSFVELNLLHDAGIDPSEYEDLPREVTYKLYSDILGHLPFLSAKDIPLFNALDSNPHLRKFAIDASSLYASANISIAPLAGDIEDAVATISYQNNASGYRFINTSNEWLSQFNNLSASHEFHGDRGLLGNHRETIRLFGDWLVKHTESDRYSYVNPYYDPIKESQMNMVAILLFEEMVPLDLYYKWRSLSDEAEKMIEQFSSYNTKVLKFIASVSATNS